MLMCDWYYVGSSSDLPRRIGLTEHRDHVEQPAILFVKGFPAIGAADRIITLQDCLLAGCCRSSYQPFSSRLHADERHSHGLVRPQAPSCAQPATPRDRKRVV